MKKRNLFLTYFFACTFMTFLIYFAQGIFFGEKNLDWLNIAIKVIGSILITTPLIAYHIWGRDN